MDGKELFWDLAATVANTKASEEETELFAELALSRLTDDPDSATDTLIAALHEGVSAVVVAAYGMHNTATTRNRDIEPDDLHRWLAAIREGTEKSDGRPIPVRDLQRELIRINQQTVD